MLNEQRGAATRSRILFVDDDPFLLEGLRDALRPHRHRWQMTFVNGGQDALRVLEHEPQDVIVCDLRMPSMDGATVLEEVRKRCPGAVRIVLSGHGEARMVARAATLAHRMISKPCDSEELARIIDSSCRVREVATGERLDGRLLTDAGVPSVPRLYAEMTQLLSDGQATIGDAARLVQRDIGMAAKVLQLANSAYFGRRSPVSDIAQAVAYLGLEYLRALILQTEVIHAFRLKRPIPGFDLERIQDHGTAVACVAKAVSPAGPPRNDAFTAGLLEDIGLLVLAAHHSDDLARVIRIATRDGRPVHEIERELNGTTHADLGAHLLALWGLPPAVTNAVAGHHAAAVLELPLDTTAAVRVATVVVEEFDGDAGALGAPGGRFSESEISSPAMGPLLDRARAAAGVRAA